MVTTNEMETEHSWTMRTTHSEIRGQLQVYTFFSVCQKLVAHVQILCGHRYCSH